MCLAWGQRCRVLVLRCPVWALMRLAGGQRCRVRVLRCPVWALMRLAWGQHRRVLVQRALAELAAQAPLGRANPLGRRASQNPQNPQSLQIRLVTCSFAALSPNRCPEERFRAGFGKRAVDHD